MFFILISSRNKNKKQDKNKYADDSFFNSEIWRKNLTFKQFSFNAEKNIIILTILLL